MRSSLIGLDYQVICDHSHCSRWSQTRPGPKSELMSSSSANQSSVLAQLTNHRPGKSQIAQSYLLSVTINITQQHFNKDRMMLGCRIPPITDSKYLFISFAWKLNKRLFQSGNGFNQNQLGSDTCSTIIDIQ